MSEQLAAEIEEAFGEVGLGDGLSLSQAQALDHMEAPEIVQRARNKDHDVRWQEIPDDRVEEYHYALTYLDPQGLRFYLPRFMVFALDHPGIDSPAVDAAVYACDLGDELQDEVLAQFNSMSRRQMTVIAQFLAFIAESKDQDYDTLVAAMALEAFWYRFLEPSTAR